MLHSNNNSELVLRSAIQSLPRCHLLDAVAPRVLNHDTLHLPSPPPPHPPSQEKGWQPPRSAAQQLHALPARLAVAPAVPPLSAQNTFPDIHSKLGKARPCTSAGNDDQGSNLSPTRPCSALPLQPPGTGLLSGECTSLYQPDFLQG